MRTHEGLPYIEPAFGKHALPMDREQAREDAIRYLGNGHRILPGWGLHRSTHPLAAIRAALGKAA